MIGVTPEGFTGTTALVSPEMFVPLGAYNLVMNDFESHGKPLAARDNGDLIVVGRLKPDITQQMADAKLSVSPHKWKRRFQPKTKIRRCWFVHCRA